MNILVINAGSSSLKYQLINMDNESVIAKGNAERIGIPNSKLVHSKNGEKIEINGDMKNHTEAISQVLHALVDENYGVVKSMDEIHAVGHRVVHGGEHFADSVLITDEVMQAIESNIDLAPLHNPANIMGIKACKEVMPNTPMVAVFDTAFHQSMPAKAYMYALPYDAYKNHKVRRYGFHGTSHKFVAQRAAEIVGKPIESLKIITCHLGNGSSIAAVKYGKSVDTSMGMTPLEGLPMGTRCGNIDPAIVEYLMKKENMDIAQMTEYLNKKSGVYGLSGLSSDFRDLTAGMYEGNKLAELALEVFSYSVKKFIGAYAAAMDGVDIVVFTAGVGENTPEARERVLEDMTYLGINYDREKNYSLAKGQEARLSTPDSKVDVLVIPTNEELVIARDTLKLCQC